jgi:hypothetical protein
MEYLKNSEAVRLVMCQVGSLVETQEQVLQIISLLEDLVTVKNPLRRLHEVLETCQEITQNNLCARFAAALDSGTFDASSFQTVLTAALAELVVGSFATSGKTESRCFVGDFADTMVMRSDLRVSQETPFVGRLDAYRVSQSAGLKSVADLADKRLAGQTLEDLIDVRRALTAGNICQPPKEKQADALRQRHNGPGERAVDREIIAGLKEPLRRLVPDLANEFVNLKMRIRRRHPIERSPTTVEEDMRRWYYAKLRLVNQ